MSDFSCICNLVCNKILFETTANVIEGYLSEAIRQPGRLGPTMVNAGGGGSRIAEKMDETGVYVDILDKI